MSGQNQAVDPGLSDNQTGMSINRVNPGVSNGQTGSEQLKRAAENSADLSISVHSKRLRGPEQSVSKNPI